ncbi:unnamed protein product [Symbiodinium microadriaticum]|nr:unnamed protein product [Symbiodinium microadriaticum]
MKTHKLIQTLSHGIKSILVRNLCNPSTVQFSPPSPCIEIYGAVRQQDSTTCDTHRIFKGGTLPLCCNPSWPGLDFKSDIFKDHQDINELHFRIYDDVENNSEEGGKVLIHQCEWDIKKLVRIGGHISLSNIPALPHNAILLALEDGGLLVDERLYLTLRANGFISVTNKYNSDEGSEETDEYAQRDEVKWSALNALVSVTTALLL